VSGDFKNIVNDELVAISISRYFRDVVVCGTGSTVITGCMSRTTTIHMRRTGRSFMTSAVVAASGYNEVNEFGYLSSQSVDLVPDDEYQFVILDSIGDGVGCGYADGAAVLFCHQDGSLHSRTV
jgi:hypothetical protein